MKRGMTLAHPIKACAGRDGKGEKGVSTSICTPRSDSPDAATMTTEPSMSKTSAPCGSWSGPVAYGEKREQENEMGRLGLDEAVLRA